MIKDNKHRLESEKGCEFYVSTVFGILLWEKCSYFTVQQNCRQTL